MSSGGAALQSSRHEGTTTMRARRMASSPCGTTSEKPALVRSSPGSGAHTCTRKRGAPASVRSSPKTMQGTDRWKGLMPSKATTATVSVAAVLMARSYR